MSMHQHVSSRPWRYDKERHAIVASTWLVDPSDDDEESGIRNNVIGTRGNMGGYDTQADIDLIIAAVNEHDARVAVCDAARVLETMAFRRENTMGDPCSLLDAKANLAAAAKKVKEALVELDELMKGKQTC